MKTSKEIFMGFLLGSMGLPTGIRTNKKTGKREWGLGWTGGIKDQVMSFKQKRKNLDFIKFCISGLFWSFLVI